jgi:uncharacterized protein HemY
VIGILQKNRLIETDRYDKALGIVKQYLKKYPDTESELRQLLETLPYRFVDYKWKDIARCHESSGNLELNSVLEVMLLVGSNPEFVKANYILSEKLRERGYRLQEGERFSGSTKNLEHKDVPELDYDSRQFEFLNGNRD